MEAKRARVKTTTLLGILLLGLACDAPNSSGPPQKNLEPRFSLADDCDVQVIPDENCVSDPFPASTAYYDEMDGFGTFEFNLQADPTAPNLCPFEFRANLLPFTLLPEHLTFLSTGTWIKKFRQTLDLQHFASYWWPEGDFPTTDGSLRTVSVDYGDAYCYIKPGARGVTIEMQKVYGVKIKGAAGGSGGGGDGSGDGGDVGGDPEEEDAVIEFNCTETYYEDGSYRLYCERV